MIKIEDLVYAIQAAVTGANDALQNQAGEFLDRFFDTVQQPVAEGEEAQLASETLRPRYVTMEYPTETPEGIKTLSVNVPLIAMVPIVHSRIEEVVFRSALDVQQQDNGDVTVAFVAPPSKSGFFKRDSVSAPAPNATEVEIRIRGDESPEGLRKIVEGYTRALRAQIPG